MNQSLAFNQIAAAHREIILGLISNGALEVIDEAKVIPEGPVGAKVRYGCTLFINHCLSLFVFLETEVINQQGWEGFITDARDMFHLPVMRQRWQEVQSFYPKDFRAFIDETVIATGQQRL